MRCIPTTGAFRAISHCLRGRRSWPRWLENKPYPQADFLRNAFSAESERLAGGEREPRAQFCLGAILALPRIDLLPKADLPALLAELQPKVEREAPKPKEAPKPEKEAEEDGLQEEEDEEELRREREEADREMKDGPDALPPAEPTVARGALADPADPFGTGSDNPDDVEDDIESDEAE